ncbi:MAG: RNA-guided pseudouridylation complex pseudouridine synthase subunit Cbf5 [archaeon]
MNIEKIKKQKSIKELLEFSIINIDKPSGPTSFKVDDYLRKELGLRKTTHFGTLDPKVTGVLPIALNRASRLQQYFMHKNKSYIGIMRIHKEIDMGDLKKELSKFTGKIIQKPPVKSRVKRQEREREIFTFKILEQDGRDFLFETEVQAGTYIRKLIHDLGKNIDGAHMLELRRTKASIFDEKDSVNLYKFKEAVEEYKKGSEEKLREILIPAEIISEILPVVQVKKDALDKLYNGSPIHKEMIKGEFGEGMVAVFSKEVFIGIYEANKPKFVLN